MGRVFLSYSTRNADVAQRLVRDLHLRGIEVYYADLDMALGTAILEELHEKIARCDCFLLLLSEHSVRSAWVEREIAFALEQQGRNQLHIVPVLVSPCVIPASLSHLKYLDLTASYESGVDFVVRSILRVSVTPHPNIGVVLARKGGSGQKGQRAAYGVVGFPGKLMFHWVIDSVGDAAWAIQATSSVHETLFTMAKALVENENVRKSLFEDDAPKLNPLVTQLFAMMNVMAFAVRTDAMKENKRVGSKAVLALQRPGEVLCATLGTCGGLARWDTPDGTAYQRIETPSYFSNELIQVEDLAVQAVAPLGFFQSDDLKVELKAYPQRGTDDFIALTSFGLRTGEMAMKEVVEELTGKNLAETAALLCGRNLAVHEDCVCAVLSPLTPPARNQD